MEENFNKVTLRTAPLTELEYSFRDNSQTIQLRGWLVTDVNKNTYWVNNIDGLGSDHVTELEHILTKKISLVFTDKIVSCVPRLFLYIINSLKDGNLEQLLLMLPEKYDAYEVIVSDPSSSRGRLSPIPSSISTISY